MHYESYIIIITTVPISNILQNKIKTELELTGYIHLYTVIMCLGS